MTSGGDCMEWKYKSNYEDVFGKWKRIIEILEAGKLPGHKTIYGPCGFCAETQGTKVEDFDSFKGEDCHKCPMYSDVCGQVEEEHPESLFWEFIRANRKGTVKDALRIARIIMGRIVECAPKEGKD